MEIDSCNDLFTIKKSIRELWSDQHILSKDDSLIEHMFSLRPKMYNIYGDKEYSFLIARKKNEIIGCLGAPPFLYNFKGNTGLAFTFANWVVKEKHRHTGAGLKLINTVQEKKPNAIIVLGIGEKALPIYKLMRWETVEDVPRWVGLVDKKNTEEFLLNGNTQPLRYYDEVQAKYTTASFKIVTMLEETKWNDFYWNIFAPTTIGVARDFEFLQWRYMEHPTFNYQFLIYEDEEGYKGLSVVRIEEIAGGQKIGRIVEMMYSTQDAAIALANAVIGLDKEVLFYDFYCFTSKVTWGLEAVGFKKVVKTKEDPFVLPTRFQPVDLTTTSMAAAIYIPEKEKNKYSVINSDIWYITKGDADQDRPN